MNNSFTKVVAEAYFKVEKKSTTTAFLVFLLLCFGLSSQKREVYPGVFFRSFEKKKRNLWTIHAYLLIHTSFPSGCFTLPDKVFQYDETLCLIQ